MSNWHDGFNPVQAGNNTLRPARIIVENKYSGTIPAYGAMKATYNHTNKRYEVDIPDAANMSNIIINQDVPLLTGEIRELDHLTEFKALFSGSITLNSSTLGTQASSFTLLVGNTGLIPLSTGSGGVCTSRFFSGGTLPRYKQSLSGSFPNDTWIIDTTLSGIDTTRTLTSPVDVGTGYKAILDASTPTGYTKYVNLVFGSQGLWHEIFYTPEVNYIFPQQSGSLTFYANLEYDDSSTQQVTIEGISISNGVEIDAATGDVGVAQSWEFYSSVGGTIGQSYFKNGSAYLSKINGIRYLNSFSISTGSIASRYNRIQGLSTSFSVSLEYGYTKDETIIT
jgi:hypothetical protein